MFEDFLPITIGEKDVFERYRQVLFQSINSQNNISDLCFSNLFSWSATLDTRSRLIEDYYCIVIKIKGDYHIYAPLGHAEPESYEKVVDRLYEECGKDQKITFTMVPEGVLDVFNKLKKYKTCIEYNVNYSDYVYCNEDFTHIKNKLSRYEYKRFLKGRSPSVRFIDSQNKYTCVELMERCWCNNNDCAGCHFGCEREALKRLINNYESLGCVGALAFDGEEPLAFIIAEHLSTDMIGYQFHRAKRGIAGLPRYLYHNFSNIAHSNVLRVNFAEDMGVEGLRAFKKHFAPHVMVHKYDVVLERL